MANAQNLGTLKAEVIALEVPVDAALASATSKNALGIVGPSSEGSLKVVRSGQELNLRNGDLLLKGDSVISGQNGASTVYLGKSNTSKLSAIQLPADTSVLIDDSSDVALSEDAATLMANAQEVELAEVLAAAETEQTQGIFGAALGFSAAIPVSIAGVATTAVLLNSNNSLSTSESEPVDNTGSGTNINTNTGTGNNTNVDTNTGTGTGNSTNVDTNTGTGTGNSTNIDTNTGTGTGNSTNSGTDTGSNTDSGTNTGSTTGTGIFSSGATSLAETLPLDSIPTVGTAIESGIIAGATQLDGLASGLAGTNSDTGTNSGTSTEMGSGTGIGTFDTPTAVQASEVIVAPQSLNTVGVSDAMFGDASLNTGSPADSQITVLDPEVKIFAGADNALLGVDDINILNKVSVNSGRSDLESAGTESFSPPALKVASPDEGLAFTGAGIDLGSVLEVKNLSVELSRQNIASVVRNLNNSIQSSTAENSLTANPGVTGTDINLANGETPDVAFAGLTRDFDKGLSQLSDASPFAAQGEMVIDAFVSGRSQILSSIPAGSFDITEEVFNAAPSALPTPGRSQDIGPLGMITTPLAAGANTALTQLADNIAPTGTGTGTGTDTWTGTGTDSGTGVGMDSGAAFAHAFESASVQVVDAVFEPINTITDALVAGFENALSQFNEYSSQLQSGITTFSDASQEGFDLVTGNFSEGQSQFYDQIDEVRSLNEQPIIEALTIVGAQFSDATQTFETVALEINQSTTETLKLGITTLALEFDTTQETLVREGSDGFVALMNGASTNINENFPTFDPNQGSALVELTEQITATLRDFSGVIEGGMVSAGEEFSNRADDLSNFIGPEVSSVNASIGDSLVALANGTPPSFNSQSNTAELFSTPQEFNF